MKIMSVKIFLTLSGVDNITKLFSSSLTKNQNTLQCLSLEDLSVLLSNLRKSQE